MCERRITPQAQKRGFTLVELLVVMGIIALLISILLPALQSARAASLRVACLSNQRQIYQAAMQYMYDYRQALPGGNLLQNGRFIFLTDAAMTGGPGDTSGRLAFVRDYLRIPLSIDAASGHYRASESRGILWCPAGSRATTGGADYTAATAAHNWWNHSDYATPSLGHAWDAPTSAAPLAGAIPIPRGNRMLLRKGIFSMDLATAVKNSTSPTTQNLAAYTAHTRRGGLAGINIVNADGSGEWVPVGDLILGATSQPAFRQYVYPKDRELLTAATVWDTGGTNRIDSVTFYRNQTNGTLKASVFGY